MADKPVHTLRTGAIGVSVWLKKGSRGPRYEISASRSYFDRETEAYGYTHTMQAWNLPVLIDLLSQAREWIRERDATAEQPPSRRHPPDSRDEEPGAP